jgi:hypothetical protein
VFAPGNNPPHQIGKPGERICVHVELARPVDHGEVEALKLE